MRPVEVTAAPAVRATAGWLVHLMPLILIIWGFVAVYLVQLGIDRAGDAAMRQRGVEELAYFPSGRFVRQASIEYQDLAADFIWLRAIQYYGYHLMSDRKYEWLGHVFEILTTLDPRFAGAYYFGAITLAWDARQPSEALDLLAQGMEANQMNWQLPFNAGFISYMLLRDYGQAGRYFKIASRLPNAWPITARWAAVATARAGDFDTARQLWLDVYNGTENKVLKALVLRQLKVLKLDEMISQLQQSVERFREQEGRLPDALRELVTRGYVSALPQEPFGGRFYLEGDKVKTTTPPSKLQ